MVLTNTARNLIRDQAVTLFTTAGIGLASTLPSVADSSLFGGGTTADALDSTTGWSVSGDGGAVTLNTTSGEYLEGSGCLNLPATYSTGTATYEKTISSIDISSSEKVALWFYINDISDLTDATDTVSIVLGTGGTTNSNVYNTAFEDLSSGWNSIVFDSQTADSVNGSGLTSSDCDTVQVNVKIAASVSTNEMRIDYLRYYESGTFGITDSNKSTVTETGNLYFKTIHTVTTTESNGLTIVEAGDNNGSALLSRTTFAGVFKGSSTLLQVDKYYYID